MRDLFSVKKVKSVLTTCVAATVLLSSTAFANSKQDENAILVIGASYGNASTPFISGMQAPLGGIAVNSGRYLALGDALVRERSLSGHVINEAQAGATSFDRLACFPGPECVGPGWQGFDKQLTKALARVTAGPDIFADYVLILRGNDCNHPDAFGIPMDQTSECTVEQINQSVDNMIAVGQRAIDLGITPIYGTAPAYQNLDLPLFRDTLGWDWIVSEYAYNLYGSIYKSRIQAELPSAIFLDNMWQGFEHLGDGLHPNDKTTRKAAKRIAKAIKKHQKQNN
ncbi:hypothetical protein C2869_04480 [Saccharobesus litoralis]|uniref:SGNH/GDSL hydrolase family protein n=1 Tax=Saccharobesus litoralis TaxID=2172099 RepID=A0A2S0VNI4_9ALTE|nr:hypothetical protein [Saccharobesus litoralis]AWB65739.1 hypothetical protein C2869_04480 [Saccharobesus litoralis]